MRRHRVIFLIATPSLFISIYILFSNEIKDGDTFNSDIIYHPIRSRGHNPEDFDFRADDIEETVLKWRNVSKKWNVIDILNISKPKFIENYTNPCYLSDGNVKCLPKFMILGVCKSGTTELYDKICKHPNVIPGKVKEKFWYNRGRLAGIDLEGFANNFPSISEQDRQRFITGDGTSTTFWDNSYWMDTPENNGSTYPNILTAHLIKHIYPDTRFILILRDPVKRLYSDYNYFGIRPSSVYHPSPEDFHQRVVYSISWLNRCFETLPRRHCLYGFPYQDRQHLPRFYQRGQHGHSVPRTRIGLYSEFLDDWLTVFPMNQFVILTLEEYKKNKVELLKKIWRHIGLGLPPDAVLDDVENSKPQRQNIFTNRPMLNQTKDILTFFYRPYNIKLAKLLRDVKYLWHEQ